MAEKKEKILSKYGILAYLTATFIFLEIFLVTITNTPLTWVGVLNSLLFSFSYAVVLYLIISFLPPRAAGITTSVLLFIIVFLFSAQIIYYKVFNTYFTVFSVISGGEVVSFFSDIIYFIGINIHWVIIAFIPFIAFFFVRRRVDIKYRVHWMKKIIILFFGISFFLFALAHINLGDKSQNSAYDMYYRSFNHNMSISNLGLMTTMRLDFKRTVLGSGVKEEIPEIIVRPTPTPVPERQTPGESSDESSTTPPEPEYNVMDIDFYNLAREETDPVIRNMHEYFHSIKPTEKNDYTGMFEGYNLIFITAEAYSHLAVHPEVTPTLYKMTREGFYFKNFYTSSWDVSTSDGEYVATTGLIPKSGVWSYYRSGSNHMPFAMGNQLRALGYKTKAYHNHTYTYYNRHISHPNMGYEYKGVGNGLEVTPVWPASDLEMMENTVDEYIFDEPFHAYYMTVSGHMNYTFSGNSMSAKNREYVEHLPYTQAGKAYLAANIELDRALEYLLVRLREEGIAERTLFVMSSDHYPYGLTHEEIEDLEGHRVDKQFERFRNSLVIYADGMEPETVEKYCSSLDIIPTISNLMGLEFDSRLLMGYDIFSDSDPLIIFGFESFKSFITDKGRYNAQTREFIPAPGVEADDDYIELMKEIVDRKFYYSAKILETDYYGLVGINKD